LVPNPLITKSSVGFLDVLPHFATVSWHLGEVAKKIHGWWDSEAEMPEEIGGALSRAMGPVFSSAFPAQMGDIINSHQLIHRNL